MILKRIFFTLHYLFSDPPWDTGISPPELMDFIDRHPPGCALDLGCGTGTNAITLAEHGWEVVGVDFVPLAIRAARKKARQAGVADLITFEVGNALQMDRKPDQFDLILDIGCFHSFTREDAERYAHLVKDLLVPGGSLLLYAHLSQDETSDHGARESDLAALAEHLTLVNREDGTEGESRPSVWVEYRNLPARPG